MHAYKYYIMEAVVLLVVVASGHQCPLGFEPAQYCSSGNETRNYKCRKDLGYFIKCDEDKQQLYLLIGYCMSTYNKTIISETICMYTCIRMYAVLS